MRLLDYIVFSLMLATENCFEHMTRLSERLTSKNGTNRSPVHSFINIFFAAIEVIKVQSTLYRVIQRIF